MGKDQKNSPAAKLQKQKKAARKLKAKKPQWTDRIDFGILRAGFHLAGG